MLCGRNPFLRWFLLARSSLLVVDFFNKEISWERFGFSYRRVLIRWLLFISPLLSWLILVYLLLRDLISVQIFTTSLVKMDIDTTSAGRCSFPRSSWVTGSNSEMASVPFESTQVASLEGREMWPEVLPLLSFSNSFVVSRLTLRGFSAKSISFSKEVDEENFNLLVYKCLVSDRDGDARESLLSSFSSLKFVELKLTRPSAAIM